MVNLDNWKRATIDCTYADIPRELLEQKNKDLLLEKASTFALFDKSVSVETCKTTNRIVRDYLGITGKGPLVGMEKKLKRGLEYLEDDIDDLDTYVTGMFDARNISTALSFFTLGACPLFPRHCDAVALELEDFSQAYSRASSLSYTAGVADFDSVNNFNKEDSDMALENTNSNLNQAKVAIGQAKSSLDTMEALLQKRQTSPQ